LPRAYSASGNRNRGTAKQCQHGRIEQSSELVVHVRLDGEDGRRPVRGDKRVRELGRGGSEGRGGSDEANKGEGSSNGGETHGDDDEGVGECEA
jgi:hypothetical protein